MTKDYAKSRPKFISRRRNRYQRFSPQTARLPSWAWVLLGLFFGMLLSFLIFSKILHRPIPLAASVPPPAEHAKVVPKAPQKTERPKKPSAPKNLDATRIATPKQGVKPAPPPETRFDFYTLLPTMGVDPLLPDNTPLSKKATLPYILQAGSFKTQEQAEQLKAALALQGLEARIQIVNINAAESWYRVYMGPFTTKADALAAQQTLENGPGQGIERLNSVILKMRVS